MTPSPASTAPVDSDITPAPAMESEQVRPRSTFFLAFYLALVLIGCKAVNVTPTEDWSRPEVNRFVYDLAVISAGDVLLVLVFGMVGQTALSVAARRSGVQAFVWHTLWLLAVIIVVYGVASVRVFQYLRTPLTYPLLYLAGDAGNMSSSLSVFVTPRMIALLVGVPVLYLTLVYLSGRYLQFKRNRLVRGVQAVGLCGLIAAIVIGRRQAHGPWRDGHDAWRLSDNPHFVLLASFITPGGAARLEDDFPAEFLDDFKTVAERRAIDPSAARPTPGLRRGPKNVIVVTLESVGAQHLSLYGHRFKTWPRMEVEAANALVGDAHYSHITNTANALVSLAISRHTMHPLELWREKTVETPKMAGTSIAAALGPRGYRTACISAGNNAFKGQGAFLEGRGFDVIWDAQTAVKEFGYEEFFSWGVEDRVLVDMVLKFIDRPDPDLKSQNPNPPFFIFAWTQGTHHPYGPETYEPSPGWDNPDFLTPGDEKLYGNMSWDLGRYLRALYEADKQLKRLLDELRKRGLADDTIVIIVGDHGEAFGHPHENYGHSYKVYDEDVKVPLMIWNPVLFKGAGRSPRISSHIDIAPTILDLLGVELPGEWQGRSLFAPISDAERRAYFYGAKDDYIFGVRDGSMKYILNATLGRDELYDLGRDPDERLNLAKERPEQARLLRQRLAAWTHYQR